MNNKSTRRASEVETIAELFTELGLRSIAHHFKDFSPIEVIMKARNNELVTIPGIGVGKQQKIQAEMRRVGLIRCESIEETHAREFLWWLCDKKRVLETLLTAENYEKRTMERNTLELIEQAFDALLSIRQKETLTLHFGLFGEEPHTFAAISKRYGATRESAEISARRAACKIQASISMPELCRKFSYMIGIAPEYFDHSNSG